MRGAVHTPPLDVLGRGVDSASQLPPGAGDSSTRAIDGILKRIDADVVGLKLVRDSSCRPRHWVVPHHTHGVRWDE